MAKAGHNGVDPKVLARWTGEVLRVYDDLAAQKIANMDKCKEIREPLTDLYDAAKNAGLNLKAFKSHIKVELAQRAYERAVAKAEPEDDEDLEAFEALRAVAEAGDLFDAAVQANEKKKGGGKKATDDDEKDVRPRHLKDLEQQRVEENTRRLEEGISGLPNADATDA
ncbi:MAG: hypothetical protein KGZ68_00995 [Dechloromonas sp.]|nr:hypothetical protein [Dechloromonas sp.]